MNISFLAFSPTDPRSKYLQIDRLLLMMHAGVDSSFAIVVARFRPPNRAEIANGGESIVSFESEDTCSLNVRHLPHCFFSLSILGDENEDESTGSGPLRCGAFG